MATLVLPDMSIPGRYVTREGPTVPATLYRGVVTWRDGNGREHVEILARGTDKRLLMGGHQPRQAHRALPSGAVLHAGAVQRANRMCP